MKRKFKGFTLVECLVALAILGIASMVMAQIYAGVSRNNKTNHLVNSSLSSQMKVVEEAAKADSVEIKFNNGASYTSKTPPHNGLPSSNYVKVVKLDPETNLPITAGAGVYSYPVDIYVLQSRNRQGNVIGADGDAGYTEKDYNLRYKYFLGH